MDGRPLHASPQDEVRVHVVPRLTCHSSPTARSTPTRSRFYGPIVHTLPAAIAPWVDEWVKLTEWDMPPEKPYLFSMATDWERGHSSSSWTSCVKACMLRHAAVACPPKQLRASFCTFLRSHEEGVDEELRESVAKAMCARLLPLPLLCIGVG